jgi:hypothetical protein
MFEKNPFGSLFSPLSCGQGKNLRLRCGDHFPSRAYFFLTSFFAAARGAMPPLSGWPEPSRAV